MKCLPSPRLSSFSWPSRSPTPDLAAFGLVKEQTELTATLEVPRIELKERSMAILDRLPVVDFNIEDIPIEEGIALLYQRREVAHVGD